MSEADKASSSEDTSEDERLSFTGGIFDLRSSSEDEFDFGKENEKQPLTEAKVEISDENLWICSECGKRFFYDFSLKAHLQKHVREMIKIEKKDADRKKNIRGPNYCCEKCEAKFYRHYDLKVHARTHVALKNIHCYKCPRTFGNMGALKIHLAFRHK